MDILLMEKCVIPKYIEEGLEWLAKSKIREMDNSLQNIKQSIAENRVLF